MKINRVVSHPKVSGNAGKVAFERGPVLFCFEGLDNGGKASEIVIPDNAQMTFKFDSTLLGGVHTITGRGYSLHNEGKKPGTFTAIPYYLWSNRGAGKMAVWVKRGKSDI